MSYTSEKMLRIGSSNSDSGLGVGDPTSQDSLVTPLRGGCTSEDSDSSLGEKLDRCFDPRRDEVEEEDDEEDYDPGELTSVSCNASVAEEKEEEEAASERPYHRIDRVVRLSRAKGPDGQARQAVVGETSSLLRQRTDKE